jgi:DNA-binding NarL/FixJ family response regulator
MTLRVVLGEDSLIVREGLHQLLEADPGLAVVGVAADMTALRDECERTRPDVVITDIRMPPTNTDEGIRFAEDMSEAERSPLHELTAREREVLVEIAKGKSNTAIAESLFLTKRAVEKHINAIFLKLGLADAEDVSKRVKAALILLAQAGSADAPAPS